MLPIDLHRGHRPLSRNTQFKILTLAAAAITAVALLIWGVSLLGAGSAPAAASAAAPAEGFRPTSEQWTSIQTAPIRDFSFQSFVSTDGVVATDDDAATPVYSPYSGRVTKLFVKAGDTVAQGAPLFAIQASEIAQAENDLITAVAALATAQAQAELARTNAARQTALLEAKGAALKDVQQSRVDLATAEGGLRTAQVALSAVRNRLQILGRSAADITAMESLPPGSTASAEAIVSAPIAGIVTLRQIGLGQNLVNLANGGTAPVFSIGNPFKVWLVAAVREADAPQVRTGDPIEAHTVAYGDRVFRGSLNYVAAGIDPGTHRLAVHAVIDNPDLSLKPQMFADCRIFTGPARSAPGVPTEAVIYEGADARVWVVNADRSISLRQIRVGRLEQGLVEVTDGLRAGDTVVTGGSLLIDRAARSN